MDAFFSTLISLALALLLSLGLGRIAARIGVPRVTVYLLVGVVLGPDVGLRFFDEGQILFGQAEDRDFREVDLLIARQGQQQIDRPFKTVQADDQFGGARHRTRWRVIGYRLFETVDH